MKVLLILVDGMRPDSLQDISYVSKLKEKASYSLEAKTVYPSDTLPCHMSLFHSVDPECHGTTTNTYHSARSYMHVTIINSVHLHIQKSTMLPVFGITTTLLFFFLPLGISVEKVLNLARRSRIRVMHLNLSIDLLGSHCTFKETSGIGLVVIGELLVGVNRKIIPS